MGAKGATGQVDKLQDHFSRRIPGESTLIFSRTCFGMSVMVYIDGTVVFVDATQLHFIFIHIFER